MKTRDWNGTINTLTGWLVGLLAIIAFVLSYNALRHVAADYGVPSELSYAWPLLVDFALIVFSLAVLRASLLSERTVWPWFLTGLFTVATIGFNLVHAPENLTSRIVAVVAPVALFLSFETLMGMVKNGVKRAGSLASIEQLNEAIKGLTLELDIKRDEVTVETNSAHAQLLELASQREMLTLELDALREERQEILDSKLVAKDIGVASDKLELARQVLTRYQLEGLPLPSGADLGRELGVSRTAGGKVKRALLPEFAVNGNGHN